MTGWGFWAVAVSLAVVVAVALIRALGSVRTEGGGTGDADLVVYKDQLAEIERDLGRGTLSQEEAVRLRAEVGKRVLDADRARRGHAGSDRGRASPVLATALVLGLTLPGALAGYWWLGAPGYPDMGLAPRLAALDAGIAGRPSQEAELLSLNAARDPALDKALSEELGTQSDPAGLRALFRKHFEAGEMQAAVRTQERLLAVEGERAASADHANLALALVAEAQGYVSPEAEAELRESLKKDMTNELARYLVGEMFLQGGRYDQAFRFWRPLAESGDPAAPWTKSIQERIVQVAELAGVRYSLPGGDAKGPTAGDMAAAQDMTPEERQQMIEGMVAQLSDRLATDGGTVEEWNRLIRSLTVLDRKSEAQKIYDEAKVKFAGQSAELSFLKQAAVESGLSP